MAPFKQFMMNGILLSVPMGTGHSHKFTRWDFTMPNAFPLEPTDRQAMFLKSRAAEDILRITSERRITR